MQDQITSSNNIKFDSHWLRAGQESGEMLAFDVLGKWIIRSILRTLNTTEDEMLWVHYLAVMQCE
jgi:hypothetical protein